MARGRLASALLTLACYALIAAPPHASAAIARARGKKGVHDEFVLGLLEFMSGRFFRLKDFTKNETYSQIWFAMPNRTIHRVDACHPCNNRYTVCAPWWTHTTTEFLIPVHTIPSLVLPKLNVSDEPFHCDMSPQHATIPVHDKLKRRFVQVGRSPQCSRRR